MGKIDTKQLIVNTASELFYTNGYNSTGINEIIAKTKIAKATLYHHFRSKESICVAYLEHRHTQFLEEFRAFANQRNSSQQKLLSIFDFLRDLYRKENFYGCWGIKTMGEISPSNKKILNVIQKQKKELLLFLGEIVGDTIANISIAEKEKITGGIYLLYEGAVTESHLHKNEWPIHLAKSIAQSLFKDSNLRK